MKSISILAIILISLFSLNICDQAETVNNVTLSAQATGELVVSNTYIKNNATVEDTINIKLKSLVEKDVNGTVITDSNHSFSDFTGFNITVTPFQSGKLNNVSLSFANITITNSSEATNNFTVELSALIFSEEGEIQTGGAELVKVGPGYVKFEFMVRNWAFCSNLTVIPCEDNQTGSFLDLAFDVKGSKNATKDHDLKYKIGNSDLILSNYNSIDSANSTKLPTGFPQYQRTVDTDEFTVRFPTFEKSAFYDPIVVMERVELQHSNLWLIVGIVVAILAIVAVVFVVVRCFKNGRKQEALMP